jgi:hypothetical protein
MQRQERRIARSAERATHLSEEGEHSDSQSEDDLKGCYAMAPLQGNIDKACCPCKASSGKSHGPDCQESLNAAIAAGSKRVLLAPLPSNSLNQGWVSWRECFWLCVVYATRICVVYVVGRELVCAAFVCVCVCRGEACR